MTKKLAGKVALVTGGSRGVGAATARALADDGADVAISFLASPDKADGVVEDLERIGVRVASFKADQGDTAEIKGLVDAVVERFGRLDILVNNAGMFVVAPVDNPRNRADLERQYAVNLGGAIAAIRAAASVMSEGGRIITLGCAVHTRVGMGGLADYAAAKSAVIGYTKGAARDLATRNITVNVVQSGFVEGDADSANSQYAQAFQAASAFGRCARPEEIAAAIVFLASPDASYITGTVLNVDGGYGA
jgi:NAD(P)-dependent dehydrogenase (short-subunit alcohol dehydrogenase family)